MKKLLTGILIASSVFSTGTYAKGETGSGPNPYSECGIGAALFTDTEWAAVSSNVIWDLGTTAITSATASPETCNAKKMKTAQFILDNYDNLVQETAKGEGDHLTAVLNISGCSASNHAKIIPSIRYEMASEVSAADYNSEHVMSKSNAYYQILNSATKGCTA